MRILTTLIMIMDFPKQNFGLAMWQNALTNLAIDLTDRCSKKALCRN